MRCSRQRGSTNGVTQGRVASVTERSDIKTNRAADERGIRSCDGQLVLKARRRYGQYNG